MSIQGKFMINKIVHKLQNWTNKYFAAKRAKKLQNANFTIISNNCWAGSVYRWFGLPYNTPTAGLYFFAEDYIKFLSNLNYYCTQKVTIIDISESKYLDILRQKNQTHVPIGRIDDIEIVFLHYPTPEEALEKWYRRTSRINWDNIYIKMSEMNGCTKEHILKFDKLPFKHKFIFTTKDYGIKSQIIMSDWVGSDQVRDDTTWFNKYINVTDFINGELV